jgi:MoaA/NifB/PqqE/SkfB family radical SAM enzyme
MITPPIKKYKSERSLVKMIKDIIIKMIPETSWFYKSIYLFMQKMLSNKKLKPKALLAFDIHLADHCNLNCKGCEHFSSIADEWYLDITGFERDCIKLNELTDGHIERLSLLGGEPLLHPKLIEILNISRKYFNEGLINVLTNGILLLKQPKEFWETCRKNNIEVFITKYPIKLDFTQIEKLSDLYGVKLVYEGQTSVSIKTLRLKPLDLNGMQNIKYNFTHCYMPNKCVQLYEGKMYTCAIIPYVKYFNKYFGQTLKVAEEDYIDIHHVENINQIFEFLCRPIPFCRYCKIKSMKFGLKWSVSKKEISEWT